MKEEAGSPDDCDTLPEWVEALRPVAKMATNVGSRIRIKVKEALELDPPEWARELLEWSISKEVFKSNASGPTKVCVAFKKVTFTRSLSSLIAVISSSFTVFLKHSELRNFTFFFLEVLQMSLFKFQGFFLSF